MSTEQINEQALSQLRVDTLQIFPVPDEAHELRVSTDKLPIVESDQVQFQELAIAIPGYIDGASRLMNMTLIDDKTRRSSKLYRNLRKVLGLGSMYNQTLNSPDRHQSRKDLVRDYDAEYQLAQTNYHENFLATRIDLVRAADGSFGIAELEPGKTHGFGYTTLSRLNSNPIGIGLANHVAGLTHEDGGALIVPKEERFYLPESKLFANAVNGIGGNLNVYNQLDLETGQNGITHRTTGNIVTNLLYLPEMSKNGYASVPDSKAILEASVKLCYDFNQVLSNKIIMGIISNPTANEEIEALCAACFDFQSLAILRKYIPETYPIGLLDSAERDQIKVQVATHSEDYFVKSIVPNQVQKE